MERCPICQVSVKTENMVRHLDDNHPRHTEARALRAQLRQEAKYTRPRSPSRPVRLRKIHVAILAGVLLVGLGAYAAAPYFDPYANFSVDSCIEHTAITAQPPYHIHPVLRVVVHGTPYPIPQNVGAPPGGCMRPIHTHAGSDPQTGWVQLHVERPVLKDFTLGDFFRVWGQPFTPIQILTYVADGTNVVSMSVNGEPSQAYGDLVLQDGQQIEIRYGPAT